MFRIIGLLMVLSAVLGYYVASLPVIDTLFGGLIGDNMDFIKVNIAWIIPFGVFLYTGATLSKHPFGLYIAGGISVAVWVAAMMLLGVPLW